MPKIPFYASQNTAVGFQSRYETIFSEEQLEHLLIIQGGPGTGKSHLMKQIAAAWQADGSWVECFLCSSDPDSLDGVYHPKRRIAVIDGTPPHGKKMSYPGCFSTLINTGDFWNEDHLRKHREQVRALVKEKEQAYTAAYAYLRAAGQIAAERRRLAMQDLDRDKLLAAARRFLKKELSEQGEGRRSIRLTNSYTKQGFHPLRSFEALSVRRCLVCDHFGTGSLFLDVLEKESGLDCIRSYSPLFFGELDGLYFPQKQLCVVCEQKQAWENDFPQADRYVNMERFLSSDVVRNHRQKLRFAEKCRLSLERAATEALDQASRFHRRLEEIYTSAMDFVAFSQFEKETVHSLS